MLQHFFGDDATIAAASGTWPLLGVTRSWKTFTEMSKEVIDARVWGGIHTRTADEYADATYRTRRTVAIGATLRPRKARFRVTRQAAALRSPGT